MKKKLLFVSITVALPFLAALVVAELGLRTAGRIPTRRSTLDYPDTWRKGGPGPGGSLLEGFRGEVQDGYGGTVRWVNNSLGFRNEREVSREPEPGVLRVLSLGDSFTAGYRVDQERTFSRLIEARLADRLGRVEVLVACAEDPAAGLDYLLRFGHTFRPHVLLLGVTLGNDVAQSYLALDPAGTFRLTVEPGAVALERNPERGALGFRHGLETFLIPAEHLEPPGRARSAAVKLSHLQVLQAVHDPAWPIGSWYGRLERPNLLDPTHGLGFFLAEPPPIIEEAHARLARLLQAFQATSDAHGIELAVALFPQRFQVQPADWQQTIVKYGLKESAFDLAAPARRILEACREAGVTCIDPTATMRERHLQSGTSLYLPRGDMHWNALGHAAFCDAAEPALAAVAAPAFERCCG